MNKGAGKKVEGKKEGGKTKKGEKIKVRRRTGIMKGQGVNEE